MVKRTLYALVRKGELCGDVYDGTYTVYMYTTRKDAVSARFDYCGILGVDIKDVSIVKYQKVTQ